MPVSPNFDIKRWAYQTGTVQCQRVPTAAIPECKWPRTLTPSVPRFFID
jgi:hypothetical protein